MNYNKDTNRPFTDSLLRNSNPKLFYSENSFCIPKNKDKNNTTDTQFIVYKVGDDSFQTVLQRKKNNLEMMLT